MLSFIQPDWPAVSVKAFTTTRQGGVSQPPYDSLNLGDHVGDTALSVEKNRDILNRQAQLPESPRWLKQTHSTTVINSDDWLSGAEADAIISTTEKHVCSILTADCLPILLCNRQGNAVAAIHAGWRGLANGIIEQTVARFPAKTEDMMVWFGPAIGPNSFEVGEDVFSAFTAHSPQSKTAFRQVDSRHYLADLYLLATFRLQNLGINAIYGGNFCTKMQQEHFFSYRRDHDTGRMATIIWIEPK